MIASAAAFTAVVADGDARRSASTANVSDATIAKMASAATIPHVVRRARCERLPSCHNATSVVAMSTATIPAA